MRVVDLSWVGWKMKKYEVKHALLHELLCKYLEKYNQYPDIFENDEGGKLAAQSFSSCAYWWDDVLIPDADTTLNWAGITKIRFHKSTGLCSYEGGDVFEEKPKERKSWTKDYCYRNGNMYYIGD